MVVEVREAGLRTIESLYETGRYGTAHRIAHASGLFDVTRATPAEHAVLAGRILRTTGAPRRGRKILLETWRRHRSDHRACVFAAYELLSAAPLAALDWMDSIGELDGASSDLGSDWRAARAIGYAELRDFSMAERAWQAARELHEDAWTWCVRARIDDVRDHVDAALVAVERAREHARWYRPAVELAARVLIRARRAAEARTLLIEATAHLEATSTQLLLAALHRDAGDLDAAIASAERAVMFAPAMEREVHDHVAWELDWCHYLRGDAERGARLMRLVDDDDARAIAERISTNRGVREMLPVPHVPQHHNTCAPATLTAIAEMWGANVDHVEVAEEICHDGTPAGSERKWAEERGFVARQLTVTWDSARTLIDAGIPFALTTSFTLGAHLQPVAGYDERRRSLIVPDPAAPWCVDRDWEALATSQAPFGPRGMAFVPASRRAELEALELPDATLYDHHHALELALQRHDRAAATAAYERLVAEAPADHYLVHHARRALASYDGDERGMLQWVAALRRRFPDDPWLRMAELASLHGHASDERRAELAAGLVDGHGRDPGIAVACARFLLGVGEHVRARALAARAIRSAGEHAGAYRLAADAAWAAGERARATRLYRIASCLADRDEDAAWSYFVASLITGDVDAALAYLADRVERMQSRSGAPARTLCEAFAVIGRAGEGLAILDAAIAAHPDDGALLLVASEHHRLSRDLERAQQCIDRARGKTPDAVWQRAAAALAVQRGDIAGALALRRALVGADPLDLDSQAAYVALLERTGAWHEARAHVLATCERFPFHIPLARLCDEVLRVREPETARARLAAFLERQPRNAWALHRLADDHARRHAIDDARALLARARTCTDDVAMLEALEAAIDLRTGRRDDAVAHLLASIQIDVDATNAVSVLLELARDATEARGFLDTIAGALARQGSSGAGLLAYAECLQAWYDPLTALAKLRELRVARTYLWHAWSAEIDALLGAGRPDEAAALATEATQRFGHDLRSWSQLAAVEGERGNRKAQIAALERTLELDPHATDAMRRLVEAYLAADDVARARALAERALAEEPFAEGNHGYLARIAKLEGDDAAARAHLARALELTPEYVWAWQQLFEWTDDERDVLAALRDSLARHPVAILPRVLLARNATDLAVDDRLALLDEASRLAPERVDVYDAKAELLARHERWDDALAACRPAFWGEAPPITLLGRAAWVRFHRGQREQAIADMLAAIRRTPSYSWGIQQLIAWGSAVRDPVRTAERLVEAASESAFAHAVLGEAHRDAGNYELAERSFARALAIDGTHQLARLGLFDALFARNKYDDAEPLLDVLDADHPFVMARRIQVHAAKGRLDDADALFARILRREIEDEEIVRDALVGYRAANQLRRAEALLERLMAEPDAPRAVAVAWWSHVGRFVPPFWRWRRIKRFAPSKATDWAMACHVEQYGETRAFGGLVAFALLHWREVRRRTDLWGSVGYSLLGTGHPWLARWWMRDYAARDGVAPWMLNNLVRVLAGHGAVTRALEVCRRAVELPPDHVTHSALLLLAPVDALDDVDSAARALSAARRAPWGGEERFLAELATAVIAYAKSARDLNALDDLGDAFDQLWRARRADVTAVAYRLFEYVAKRIARRLGKRAAPWLERMLRLPGAR